MDSLFPCVPNDEYLDTICTSQRDPERSLFIAVITRALWDWVDMQELWLKRTKAAEALEAITGLDQPVAWGTVVTIERRLRDLSEFFCSPASIAVNVTWISQWFTMDDEKFRRQVWDCLGKYPRPREVIITGLRDKYKPRTKPNRGRFKK